MKQAEEFEPAKQWSVVSLVFMDDKAIAKVNKDHLGRDCPTDVITFQYDPIPGVDNGLCGEVIINVERAGQEGLQREGASEELALYLAHGCLHLAGATDYTPEDREKMELRQDKWLARARKLNYTISLLQDEETPNQ